MKVLIVRIGAMGDVIHAVPAVAALRRLHPNWQIDWVVDIRWRDLLTAAGAESGPVVNEAITVRTKEWNRRPMSPATLRDVLWLRRRLRAERYDLCVDLQGTMRSSVIGWMAGARRYIGPKEPREGLALHLYGEPIAAKAMHVIDQAGEILGIAAEGGGALAAEQRAGIIPIDPEAEVWAERLVAEYAGRRGIMVMAPTAGWPSKEWPAERFGDLAGRLTEDGWVVMVNAVVATGATATPDANWTSSTRKAGARRPGEAVEVMVRESGCRAVAVPCAISQLASLLRRAKLFIGGDTGPMHLADALGVPVVALFGPTDPARTGPLGRRVRVLRAAGSVTDHRRYATTEAGLAKITVEEVYRAVVDLVGA